MELPSREVYKQEAIELSKQLPRGWIYTFSLMHDVDEKDHEKLRNSLKGRSYESAYINPGFFPKVKEFISQLKSKKENV